MSDMGVWRQENGIVVRLYGRERLLTMDETEELIGHLSSVAYGGVRESLGEGYRELEAMIELESKGSPETVDLVSLGLAKPKLTLKRRAL